MIKIYYICNIIIYHALLYFIYLSNVVYSRSLVHWAKSCWRIQFKIQNAFVRWSTYGVIVHTWERFPNLRNTTFERVQRFTWDESLAAAGPYIEILALPPRIKPMKPLHRFPHFIFFRKIEEIRKRLKVYFWGYNTDFATVIEPSWFHISLFPSLLIIRNSICSTLERILRRLCF